MRINTKLVALTSTALLSLSLMACNGADSSNASNEAKTEEQKTEQVAQEEPKATPEAASPVTATSIGETGEGVTTVMVTNSLGEDISSFAMRASGDEAWGNNLLVDNAVITNGAAVALGYRPSDPAVTYDFQLKTVGGTEVEIDGVNLTTMTEVALCVEEGKGFVNYKDADGNEGTTKDAQEAVTPQNDAEGADASYDSGEGYNYENETYYEPEETYYEPEDTYYEPEGTYQEYEPAPEQSADDCTADNIVLDV